MDFVSCLKIRNVLKEYKSDYNKSSVGDKMKCSVNRNHILIIGIMSLFIVGMIYAWSIFVTPLENEFGWTRVQSSGIYTTSMICFAFGVLLCGIISKKTNLGFTGLLGSLMISLGFGLCSVSNTLIQFYIFYGIFCGIGVGVCYNTWLTTITFWFSDRIGFASGLLLMSFGMGGMILGSIVSVLIYSNIGLRKTFLILGIFVLLESILTIPFLKNASNYRILEKGNNLQDSINNFNTSKMIQQPTFWIFTIWKMALTGIGHSIIGQASLIALDSGANITMATLAVGLLSIGNGGGRILFGIYFDRKGRFNTILMISLGFLILGIGFWMIFPLKIWVFINILLGLIGLFYGGLSLITATYISDVFGSKHFNSNMGINSLTNVPATLTFSTIISLIKVNMQTYQPFFKLMIIVCLVCLILGLSTKNFEERMSIKQRASNL